MPPRDTETARRDAQKKRGTLGPDANLGEAAVTRVRELLDRRGARGGSGSAPSSSRGATRAAPFPRGTARSPSAVDGVPETEKPRRTAKNQASAHNARLLAAASAAADLATNSGKANTNTASVARERVSKNTRLEDAIRTCGAAAAGTMASLDRAAVAAVAADAHVAAVAAAAERGGKKKQKRTDSDAVSLVSVDSDADDDSEPDEWEDVKGEKHFDAYVALDDDDDDDDEKQNVSGKSKSVARRVSPADRECLKRMHETHLLCLMARAAATEAAASDPLVKAMAVSAAPRGVAMDPLAEDSPPSTPPTIDRVARLAKWFAGAFECRAFGDVASARRGLANDDRGLSERRRPSGRRGTGTGTRDRDGRKKKPELEPVSRRARVTVVDDVIVLDDDGDFFVVEEREVMHRSDVDATSKSQSQKNASSRHLAAACASALVTPRVRLAFACARRRGTQEDLVGLFVAAARGLGLVARVVAAFDPTPHRASASELAKLGVKVGGAEDFSSRGGKRTTKRKRPRSEAGFIYRANAVACDPSFFETTAKGHVAPEEALARERVSWWAEVLCLENEKSESKTESVADNVSARWVPVVPHSAGVSKHAPRWSFKAGGALVDDARALRGASPYVYAFQSHFFDDVERNETRTAFTTRRDKKVVATDVTRKYAEAFSRCAEKRVDAEWVAETTRVVSSSFTDTDFEDFEARANARDAAEMASRAKTERVPSTMSELKNHPLYACERFLKPNQAIHPRKPVVGFVNGECVFPRSCVSELRSAERWKSEARREVLPDEITKPRAWTHSRASRAALAYAARRDAYESRAEETEDTNDDTNDAASIAKKKKEKRRRVGPRSVEEMARDMRREHMEARARTKTKTGAEEEDFSQKKKRGDIPLFGVWQTREWSPPRAVNGIVPKNERGNVDLIGAHALPPPGTAHVVLPRISRVARAWRDARAANGDGKKTRPFDFAPALVGFEYQRGGSVLPKFDGVVVCEEEEAGLRARWLETERERVAAEREKELKKAKRRWRLLLSAIWTRVALRDEFFSVSFSAETTTEKTRESDAEKTTETFGLNASVADPCSSRQKNQSALAGPATGLRPGRGAVVAGGAEAEVEEM